MSSHNSFFFQFVSWTRENESFLFSLAGTICNLSQLADALTKFNTIWTMQFNGKRYHHSSTVTHQNMMDIIIYIFSSQIFTPFPFPTPNQHQLDLEDWISNKKQSEKDNKNPNAVYTQSMDIGGDGYA